jgi:hypothetical protein
LNYYFICFQQQYILLVLICCYILFILFYFAVCSWIGVQLALLFAVMVGAAFMAFKTRNVPSAFDESQHIANAIFLLIFFAVIIVPLDILVQENPNAAIIIQGIGQSFLGIMLLVVLFGPKLYYIAIGKANDKTMLEVATSTGTKQSGSTGRKGAASVKTSTSAKSPVASSSSATNKKTSDSAATPFPAKTSIATSSSAAGIVNDVPSVAVSNIRDNIELANVVSCNDVDNFTILLRSFACDFHLQSDIDVKKFSNLIEQFDIVSEKINKLRKQL